MTIVAQRDIALKKIRENPRIVGFYSIVISTPRIGQRDRIRLNTPKICLLEAISGSLYVQDGNKLTMDEFYRKLEIFSDAKKFTRNKSYRYNISFDKCGTRKVHLDINIVLRNIWRRIFVASLLASAAEISRRRRNNFPFLHVPWALIFNKTHRGNGVPSHFLDFPFRVERISRIHYARCLAARSCPPKSNRTRHACTTNEKPGVRNKNINRILL